MKPLVVIDVVGLTPALLGESTPNLSALAAEGFRAELGAVFPAVTCAAQSTYLTGLAPADHGVVGNGWYFRDLAEVLFWRQSNHLVAGEKVWEKGRRRDAAFTCAKLFWWFNMYSGADWSVTPRPIYPADGRKIPALYSHPPGLEAALQAALGPFPFFRFWGPRADILSSDWIARSARSVIETHRPTLTLVYLPHLDYDLQRHGPRSPGLERELRAVDAAAGVVIDAARGRGMEVLVLSEYGIGEVTGSVSPNRVLRREGLLEVRDALGREILDPGASRAFAVVDHQIAHVYVRRPEDVDPVRRLLEGVEGVERVLDRDGRRELGIDHPRAGELVLVARKDRWFDYYWWLDDRRAPDFAPTVDIHRKPGYDPAELFLDPTRPLVRARILLRLAQKTLGFRYLMDVIPLDGSLVRGSHGRLPDDPRDGPVLLSSSKVGKRDRIAPAEVSDLMLETIFSDR